MSILGDATWNKFFVAKTTSAQTSLGRAVTALVSVAVLGCSALAGATASAEPIGSTCSDCAIYKAKYSIKNNTGVDVPYQFRWGDNQPWRTIILENGARKTHTYPLGSNKKGEVPTPSVRFDRIGGDGTLTWKQYVMPFHAVMVEPGYGGTLDTKRKPIRYMFVYSRDGINLDLKRK